MQYGCSDADASIKEDTVWDAGLGLGKSSTNPVPHKLFATKQDPATSQQSPVFFFTRQVVHTWNLFLMEADRGHFNLHRTDLSQTGGQTAQRHNKSSQQI